MLQDAHIHLQDARPEAARILRDSPARGVGRFFCNGSSPSDWDGVKAFAGSYGSVVPFYGVHPWYADEAGSGWEEDLRARLASGNSCIGEIGLDRARKSVDFGKQLGIFGRQLDIAFETAKPFAVHCVQAWETLLGELSSRDNRRCPPFIVHWFSGSPEVAAELTRLGAYISFSPRLLDEGAEKHRGSFVKVPLERILLETDYPYTPGAGKGEAAPPEEYFRTLEALYAAAANLRGISGEEFTKKVWDNGTVFVHRASSREREN